MDKIPEYLYHYTKIDKLESIISSNNLRLYNAFTQKSDQNEIYFAGNRFLLHYYNSFKELLKKAKYETNDNIPIILLLTIAHHFSNHPIAKEIIFLFDQIGTDEFYGELSAYLKNNPVWFYIMCMSANPYNDYLWRCYANNYNGVIIKLPKNIIPSKVAIRKVSYFAKDDIDGILEAYHHFKRQNKGSDYKDKYIAEIKNATSLSISTKEYQYSIEEEFRLIMHDTGLSPNHFTCIDTKNHYKILPINKMLIKDALKTIYYHPNISNESMQRLENIAKRNKLKIRDSSLINLNK